MTTEQDIVLVYLENEPLAFARIEDISPDHKQGWYHVTLMMLQVPVQVVTWTLRDVYIDGEEYTMGGKKMRLEKIVCPEIPGMETEGDDEDQKKISLEQKESNSSDNGSAQVICLADIKRK